MLIMKSNMLKLLIVLMVSSFVSSCKSTNETTNSNARGKGNQGSPNIDQIFETMDVDKDGKLSETEVKGPLKNDFSKIDTNSDGFLSKEEIEKAPKPNRQRPQQGRRQ